MLTARLHGVEDIRLRHEPDPQPAPGEVLLHVTAVGLCGSDRHWYEHASIGGTAMAGPLVLGHEVAATIADGPEAGARVVVEPSIPCGACATCRSGRPELCPTAGFAGYAATDGGLRTMMTWPRHLLRPIPSTIDDDEGAVLEALGVALHAVHLASVDAASTVAVIGCGPIGLLVIRSLRAAGVSSISAWDPLPHRQAAASAAGAEVLSPTADRELADVTIECGGTDSAVDDAIARVRPGGRVVLVGIPDPDRTTFTASVARRKGLTLILCRRMRTADLDRAIALVADRTIALDPVISDRYPLESVDAAFRLLASQHRLKVIVRPSASSDVGVR